MQLARRPWEPIQTGHVDRVTIFNLVGPGIEPETSRADSNVFNHSANRLVSFFFLPESNQI